MFKACLVIVLIFPRELFGFLSKSDFSKTNFTQQKHVKDDFIVSPEDTYQSSTDFNEINNWESTTVLPFSKINDGGIKTGEIKDGIKSVCGIDNSPILPVYEGTGFIERYPWLGVLFYPIGNNRFVTTVVLVTKALVIASAMDIHKMPKKNFRSKARVVLGGNCSQPSIGIKEYTLHPNYGSYTASTIALIQLDLNLAHKGNELRPICSPPSLLTNDAKFYAIVLNEDCENSKIKIFEMDHVPLDKCKEFYRTHGLDVKSIWPAHSACGRARIGGHCVWRDGTVLTVRYRGVWHLMGFGVFGPGCEAPSRFIDYSVTGQWVKKAMARVGTPAVTRESLDRIIMRRIRDNIQRFGKCDVEEVSMELYTDTTYYAPKNPPDFRTIVKYNMTIFSEINYSCIVFTVADPGTYRVRHKPRISLNFYCRTKRPICYQAGQDIIEFYVEIEYRYQCVFKMSAYGQKRSSLDVKQVTKYFNIKKERPVIQG